MPRLTLTLMELQELAVGRVWPQTQDKARALLGEKQPQQIRGQTDLYDVLGCPECGAPAGMAAAGPCQTHGTAVA